jgi:extracellular elastinolytic metalloproteinase
MIRRVLIAGLVAIALMVISFSSSTTRLSEAIGSNTAAADVALRYLADHRQEMGLTQADINDVIVTDAYTSEHTGVSHVYLRQRYQGIEVYNANINVNVASGGAVLSYGSDFVPNLAAAVNRTSPVLDATAAAQSAAASVDLIPAGLSVLEQRVGIAQEVVLSGAGISLSPIVVKLIYQPVEGAVRLAWNVEIEEVTQRHWWSLRVDAETGALLSKDDYVDYDNFGAEPRTATSSINASANGKGSTTTITNPGVDDGSSYRVFGLPLENPNHGPRSLVTEGADFSASPFGWHDTNGSGGAEFTITRGNNAHAYADTAGDGMPDPLSEPDGGAGLDFDFPLDFSQEPLQYRPAAVTNLFYWNNIIHDVFYHYGFTEAAGNFQVNNYGRGGAGNDYVQAEAQDGTPNGANPPLNNANFGTPVDGSRPRMQMYLWQPPYPNSVTVNPPSAAAGTYDATDAQFGAPVPPVGITGTVVLVNDGVGITADACEPLIGFPAGSIALLERGTCSFTIKVLNAQNAGAIAAILHNNVPGGPALRMGFATTPSPDTNAARVAIPSVMVSYDNGQRFRASQPLTATVARKLQGDRLRDGDFDSGVITHEYGHGISNRLTGGRLTVSCLNNQEQMGEGWSDFLGLALTARPGDTATQRRGVGTYILYQPTDGFGIRPTPYTTDMSGNPATYDGIKTAAVPHGVGYHWATMLWEVYWNLVEAHGYNPDIYAHWSTGGNNLAIQLVLDGMKLQKCSPGFVDGRNAILQADQILTGGANQCLIWKGFAKRGLGVSAQQGSSGSVADGTQAFDVPATCQAGISVDPPSMTATQLANTTSTQELRIQNGSLGGGADLAWSITETATNCSTPSDLPWLSVSNTSGTTKAGARSMVTVTFNSAGLSAPNACTGQLCVASNDPTRPVVSIPLTLSIIYNFQGFFGSVKNPPVLNSANPGSTVTFQFSLSGNQGLNIFQPGSPSSVEIDCHSGAQLGAPEPALSGGGGNGLSYSTIGDRYTYKWRTQGDWAAGTCREFTMRLKDGTSHRALFRFK